MVVILFLLLFFVLHFTSGRERWRGNNYIDHDGILPYQRCNSLHQSIGATKIFYEFSVHNRRYYAVNTAVSVWGSSDIDGKPTSINSIEMLVYYRHADLSADCERDLGWHCKIPTKTTKSKKSIDDDYSAWCHYMDANQSRFSIKGKLSTTASNAPYSGDILEANLIRPTASIICPITNLAILENDHFFVNVSIHDDDDTHINDFEKYSPTDVMSVDICYQHIESPSSVVICTEPHFGFELNHKNSFWYGKPPFHNGSYNLLDTFLKYHIDLHDTKVVYNDLLRQSFPAIKTYLNEWKYKDKVYYRDNWRIRYGHHGSKGHLIEDIYDYEQLCETTCHFEHRLDAAWFIILHAVDNYILPKHYGDTLKNVVDRLDENEITTALIPVNFPIGIDSIDVSEKYNILQRYPFLDMTEGYIMDSRFTPLGNPRRCSWSVVHDISVYTQFYDPEKCLNATEALKFLRTIHIHSHANKIGHKKQADLWYTDLANKLNKLLI